MIFTGGILILLLFTNKVTYAQLESGSFKFEGEIRNYKLFLPENYSSSAKSPLVFNLHPMVFGAQFEMSYTRMHLVADTMGFIVVYPSAVVEWNTGELNPDGEIKWDVDDVGFFNALIDHLSNNYSVDPERIFSCGFSNGGFMSLRLACELGHRIAAVAAVGGAMIKSNIASCNPTRNMRVMHIHGTEDLSVPIGGDPYINSVDWSLLYWAGLNNCVEKTTVVLEDIDPEDACWVEKISYTNCTNNGNVIFYKVHGGGHTWPGGNVEKYNNGNTNMDIYANYEILKFFNESQLTPAFVEDYKNELQFSIYPNPFESETTISFHIQ